LVDNSETKHVPIVIETNPKYKNIFGTVEREMEKGSVWRTDFTKVKAGSLLKADGGYLVLNALDALIEPGVWQDLKRTLRTGLIDIHLLEGIIAILFTVKTDPQQRRENHHHCSEQRPPLFPVTQHSSKGNTKRRRNK